MSTVNEDTGEILEATPVVLPEQGSIGGGMIQTIALLARANPRNERHVAKRMLAALENFPDLADISTYRFERGGKLIRGIGIKGARLIRKEWRNNLTLATHQETPDGQRIARGVFVDGEYGTVTIRDRPVPKGEKRKGEWHVFSEEEYKQHTLIEMSKAERDVILASVPEHVVRDFHDRAFELLVKQESSQGTPLARWEKAQDALKALKIPPAAALSYLRADTPEALTQKDLTALAQALNAIKQGEGSVKTIFGDHMPEERTEPAPNLAGTAKARVVERPVETSPAAKSETAEAPAAAPAPEPEAEKVPAASVAAKVDFDFG